MHRTHTCGELRLDHAGTQVTLSGWVQRTRDLGGMTFVDLRDRYGLTQLAFNMDSNVELCTQARKLGREFVIKVEGAVRERESKNNRVPTGDIEIDVTSLEVLNAAKTPPFTIEDDTDGGDDLRMQYRYLDLRRKPVQNNLFLRHRIGIETRKYLDSVDFIDVETPYLIKSTPEGARDFVVPSRMNPGQFYALPQSPQTFKQLLMVSGFDRYYQIVKCFRDEDLRADRQPEFTQIDCEMTFVEQEDILNTFEGLVRHLFKVVLDIDVPAFPRMDFDEAMRRYGSDKPDVRFDMEFVDFGPVAQGKGFGVFDSAEAVLGIVAPGCASYTRKQLDKLTDWVKRPQIGAKGLVYCKVNEDGTFKSSVDKFFSPEDQAAWAAHSGANLATSCSCSAATSTRCASNCANSACTWARSSGCATPRSSSHCGWWTSPSWSGTKTPSATTPCTTRSPRPSPSRWTSSNRILGRSRPTRTTWSSTASRSAEGPSGSTTRTSRPACSTCSASAPRKRKRSLGS